MQKNYKRLKPLLLFASLLTTFIAQATIYPFHNTLMGTQEVPPNGSSAKGMIVGWYNDETNTISYTLIFGGLTVNASAAHFHAPAPPGVIAPVIIPITVPVATQGQASGTQVISDVQETSLMAGLWYVNVHNATFPGGEIRAQISLGNPATMYIINNVYSGTQEVPPNASTATGRIIGSYNPVTNNISYGIIFSGLTVNASAAHFHAPAPAGTNAAVIIGFGGFPAATSGTYFNSNVLTDQQEGWLLSNLFYSNMHNPPFPGGEIRAQIIPNIPAGITCPPNVVLSNDPGRCSRVVSIYAGATGNPAPTIVYRIGNTIINNESYVFPVGTTMVTATATNTAGSASCNVSVTINDTEAPVITGISATPDELWPPNGKMHDITVAYTSTDNCAVAGCQLSVTSNEASGKKGADWVVIDDHHVQLRAKRDGGGDGRIYTITATCTDAAGNSTSSYTTVTVAHDKGKNNRTTLPETTTLKRLNLRLYPNPSNSEFTLAIEDAQEGGGITVRVTDLLGRLVESKAGIVGSQTVKLGKSLKAGTYLVTLSQGNETRQIKMVKVE